MSMKRKPVQIVFPVVSVILTLLAVSPAAAAPRPIADFLSTQGTYCVDDGGGGCLLFVPPVPNFIGWTVTGETTVASVDYAGLANGTLDCGGGVSGTTSFGTQADGTVIERPLPDGRVEVTVVLHTRNALTWVADGDFASGTLLFGQRVCDVLAGGQASLGDSQLQVVFINPGPGAPLPDLIELFVSRFNDLVSLSFRSQAEGALRAAFGVSDGTPGRATIVQTGTLFRTNFGGATGDGFPAERISLKVVGQ